MAKAGRALDAFDLAILRIVQQDNKRPQREIAQAVNLSAAANVALVAPDALALPITAIVQVHLRDERAATVDAAKALFCAAPEVQQCYYVTGGMSFVLVIISPDMRAYDALTRRLFSESDLVERFHTLVALDRVKTGMSLPI
ncbi:Lrp/AsnC family transcriptional regulator [Novosphingobium humi]|uniref:Lrp/AsnC family transcriptional regulator n=1 Tax=Novosphingobium humi TaxID=2282397 RepID=UPI0025AF944D|nr:Lrp/AsnC family transcriptional regulator [Novosphingobium humi]WJT00425.1 Lrp/AsnC family transcriptional regulator [Novosphingobium humi]